MTVFPGFISTTRARRFALTSLFALVRVHSFPAFNPFQTSSFDGKVQLAKLRCASKEGACITANLNMLAARAYLRPHVPDSVCGYLTDVEGNFEYFENYMAISKVLEWEDENKTALRLKDNALFVFGGDSQDKGPGDIRFTTLMISLKQRYPDRVRLIIGNRDANKLRLASELSDEVG